MTSMTRPSGLRSNKASLHGFARMPRREGEPCFLRLCFRAPPVSGLFVAIILVSTALLLITAGKARAETADERELRDHAAGNNLAARPGRSWHRA